MSRASAVVTASAILLAGVPAAASIPAHAPTTLALYIQSFPAEGAGPGAEALAFSAFAGDAMPSDPSTVHLGRFTASTHVLHREVVLDPEHTFRLALQPAVEPSAPARVEVVVAAVDLLGARIPLAHANLLLDPAVPSSPTPPPPPPLPVDPEGTIGDTLDALDDLATGNPARNALDRVYHHEVVCGRPNGASTTLYCNQTNGHYGYGQIRFCKSPRMVTTGHVHDASWAVDDAYRGTGIPGQLPGPASAFAPCSGAFDVLNATADASPVRIADDEPRTTGGADAGAAEDESDEGATWQNIRLDASAPVFERPDGAIAIPAGYRLVLEVDAEWAAPALDGGPAPLVVGVDERSRLELRTHTDDLFADFTQQAERIGIGSHSGAYTHPTDVRHFALDLAAGERLEVVPASGDVTLYDPDGVRAEGSLLTTTGAPGRWTLAVERDSDIATAFAFAVRTPATGPEPILTIGDGETSGALGQGDDEDAYELHAWRAQWISITLRAPTAGTGDAAVSFEGDPFMLRTYTETLRPDGSVSYEGRVDDTGMVAFRVLRAWGDLEYAIDVHRDPLGDLSTRPVLTTIMTLSAPRALYGGYQGSVDVETNGEIIRVSPAGATLLGEPRGPYAGPQGPHTSTGGLVAAGRALLEEGSWHILRERGDIPAFGPDGRLYYLEDDGEGNAILVGLAADRSERAIALPRPSGRYENLTFTPDGAAHVHEAEWDESFRIDVATGQAVLEPEMPVLRDLDGNGYRIMQEFDGVPTEIIERVDADDQRTSTAAWFPDGFVHQVVVSGTRLYAVIDREGPGPYELAYADLGIPMFEGFQPAFVPSPPADLRPEGLLLESRGIRVTASGVEEQFVIRVTVKNEGLGASLATNVSIVREGSPAIPSPAVPALAPGESVVVDVPWTTHPRFGDQAFDVFVDVGQKVAEEDNDDNRVEYVVPTRVPTYDACAAAFTILLAPGSTGPCERAPW